MLFMLMFSGAEHKYIIQVYQHKVIYVLSHDTIHHPLKFDGELDNPSGSIVYLNKPYLVTNAVFLEASLAKRT